MVNNTNFLRFSICLAIAILYGFSLVSAVCQTNNEFLIGENVDVCTGGCTYKSELDGIFYPCDGTVNCYLTAYYPNNSVIIQNAIMSRTNSVFNYNLGTLATEGKYKANIICNRQKGWYAADFPFTVSEIATSSSQSAGTPMLIIPADLYKIETKTSSLIYDYDNPIFVTILDRNGNRIDVANFSAQIQSTLNHTISYEKLSDGYYKVILNVPKQDAYVAYLNIKVTATAKTLESTELLNFEEKTTSLITGATFFNLENTGKYLFVIKNAIYILYGIFFLLLMSIGYIIYRMKKIH